MLVKKNKYTQAWKISTVQIKDSPCCPWLVCPPNAGLLRPSRGPACVFNKWRCITLLVITLKWISHFPVYNVHSHWQQLIMRWDLAVHKEFHRNSRDNQGTANELYIWSAFSLKEFTRFSFFKKIISVYVQVAKLFSIAATKGERKKTNCSSRLVSSFRLDSQKSVYTKSLTSDETHGCLGCSTALTSLPPKAQDRVSTSVAKQGEGPLHSQSDSFVSCRPGFPWLLRFSLDSLPQCGSHHRPGALLTCSKRFNRLFQHCAKT